MNLLENLRANRNLEARVLDVLQWSLTGIISFIILAPIVYSFSVSLRPQSEVFGPLHLIPRNPTLRFYSQFLETAGTQLINSLLIATGVSILVLLVAIPGAYAFARKDFQGRKTIFYLIVLIMLFPAIMLVIPIVQILKSFGLFNTITGVWFALMIGGLPITIWVLRDNFQKLPPNAEEAAQVYGCTEFGAFRRVVLPLATPAIIAAGFLTFLFSWTEFAYTNMLTNSGGAQPVIVTLFAMMGPDKAIVWPRLLAASFIISAPPAIFYALAQRYLASSLAG